MGCRAKIHPARPTTTKKRQAIVRGRFTIQLTTPISQKVRPGVVLMTGLVIASAGMFLLTQVEVDAANPRHVVTVRGLGYKLQS